MVQTTHWIRSYWASATLRRGRNTHSVRVTTAEYPQQELLKSNVELLCATSASDATEILIHIIELVYVKLLSLVTDISVSICCVTTVVVMTCKVNITYQRLYFTYELRVNYIIGTANFPFCYNQCYVCHLNWSPSVGCFMGK